MLKKEITYTDYNGEKRTEEFFFNLNSAELSEMELSVTGGLGEMLKKIIKTKDVPEIAKFFKTIILKSYGIKSSDGRRFIKSDELSTEFSQTEAYSDLYIELATDENKAAAFVEGILPQGEVAKTKNEQSNVVPIEAAKNDDKN